MACICDRLLNSVGDRAINFFEVPFVGAKKGAETFVGVVDGVKAIFFCGTRMGQKKTDYREGYKIADRSLGATRFIVAAPYKKFLNVFNTNALNNVKLNDGLISPVVRKFLIELADDQRKSSNPLCNAIFSRGLYAIAILASVVTRVADFVIGLIAGFLSIIPCFGYYSRLNELAFRCLQGTGIIKDCLSLTARIICPCAEIPLYTETDGKKK